MMLKLREDQEAVKRSIYREIRSGHSRVAVQAMTSFGKTALAASVIHDVLARGRSVLFTAPLVTLVEQTVDEFQRWGIDVGVIQADHPLTDYSQPVQVCSIQSIAAIMRRQPDEWAKYQRGKILIHDECHLLHKTHLSMGALTDDVVIGLSATPWRKGLGKHYDALVQGPSTRWLIDNGHLSDYRAYSHHTPDLSGVGIGPNGDYVGAVGDRYNAGVIGDIVGHWFSHAQGRKTILFAPRVSDAERFAEEFRAKGVPAKAVSGYMDQADCFSEVEKFKAGETLVLCSVAKLATGFSVRDVGCIIDAQPTRSLMRHLQKLGRGLRTHPEKTDVVILDNAGNLVRNGLPDGEYPTCLNDGTGSVKDRKQSNDPQPSECPQCHAVKPPKVRKCPACGFEPVRQTAVEVQQGELIEIKSKKANREWTWEQKQDWYAQIKGYCKAKNYRPGWSARKYQEKFGVWPNDARVKHVEAKNPEQAVVNWITSRNIAWAKRRVA